MRTTNTFSVETPKGVRSFHLHQGDICESRDDVLVVSTHANPGLNLTGAVLTSLEGRGWRFTHLEPLLVPHGCFGTYLLRDAQVKSQTVLVVRVPGAENVATTGGTPLEVLKEALWTLFGSLAALELRGDVFRSISLPVLAARRGYPIRDVLTALIANTIRWLRSSQFTEQVSLYVLQPDQFADWADELDRLLGRRYFESANDAVLAGLRQELLSLVRASRDKLNLQPDTSGWLTELAASMAEDRLRFHAVAVAGRKLAESLSGFLLEDLDVRCTGDLYTQIKAIWKTKKVAPRVTNYLMSLKDFGNEQVHTNLQAAYRPRTVNQDDLLALLCNIAGVIKTWLDWGTEEDPSEKGQSP
jgi:hypothetical protein